MSNGKITYEMAKEFVGQNMKSTSEVESDRIFMLAIGESGSGKTSLAGTAPKPIVIDADGGTIPLRNSSIDRISIGSWNDFRLVLRWLEDGDHGYETVFIDGLTKLQQMNFRHIMTSNGKSRMTQELWGVALDQGLAVIDYLGDIRTKGNCHVIVTVLERTDFDQERGAPIKRGPDLKGSLRDRICAKFDLVGFLASDEVTVEDPETKVEHSKMDYRVLFRPYGTRQEAKDRWNILDTIETPDVGAWVAKITASGGTAATSPRPRATTKPAPSANPSPKSSTPTESTAPAPSESSSTPTVRTESPSAKPTSAKPKPKPSVDDSGDSGPDFGEETGADVTIYDGKDVPELQEMVADWFADVQTKYPSDALEMATRLKQEVEDRGYTRVSDIVDRDELIALLDSLRGAEADIGG